MDRIIRITLALFIVIAGVFTGWLLYTNYVESSFRSSLTSTYTYTCTIAADGPMRNVTLFIPVPDTIGGTSPIVSEYSARSMKGLPEGWDATLYGSKKGTHVKLTGAALDTAPYTISLAANISQDSQVETEDPVADGVMFRPIQNVKAIACPPKGAVSGSYGDCIEYILPVYAEYQADPNTRLTITTSLDGKNSWNVFGPGSNEYRANASVLLFGEQGGWTSAYGILNRGIGSPAPVKLQQKTK